MWIPKLSWPEETGHKKPSVPKYVMIAEAIAAAIRDGTLKPGERMPPQRQLAWALEVNPSTVMQAYRAAARRHLISGEMGRGTYVLADSQETQLFKLKTTQSRQRGPHSNRGGAARSYDLSINVPVALSQNKAWEQKFMRTARANLTNWVNHYAPPEMIARAELALLQWVRKTRGLDLKPTQIALCAGAQQALMVAVLALMRQHEASSNDVRSAQRSKKQGASATVLVEEMTFPGMKALARQIGLPLQGVKMDRFGLCPKSFARAARSSQAKIVILMPVLHNPTTTLMPPQRRSEIIAIAREHNITLVEDDVYGALSSASPLLKDCPGGVLHIGGFSKAIAAGLRFGFIAGSEEMMAPIREQVHASVWTMAPLMLEMVSLLIEDGEADRLLRIQKQEMRARWNLARAKIKRRESAESAPGPEFASESGPKSALKSGPEPAPFIWLGCNGEAAQMEERCRQRGVHIVSSAFFAAGRTQPKRLRVSLTRPQTRAELAKALEILNEEGLYWPAS